jgi:hypothetical protein
MAGVAARQLVKTLVAKEGDLERMTLLSAMCNEGETVS